ncbi:hypothetical protein CASFOL_016156 [Castilleja foliolosa]|uniref:ACT domain-containing protein ACR n=1 Tax=Castilleja foliolosa TaxID=1961234 RepID=A0ABD3DFS7_9LAMI
MIKLKVTIDRCEEKDYSVVTVWCKDRSKLIFDIVCTLTDMQYVVFHATITSEGPYATQEYYMRHMDGATLETEAEKEMVIKCLEAAVRRRVSEGLNLELCAKDRVGLLSVSRAFTRERAVGYKSRCHDGWGASIKCIIRERCFWKACRCKYELRKEIGQTMRLNVKKAPTSTKALRASGSGKSSFFFGSLLEKFRA